VLTARKRWFDEYVRELTSGSVIRPAKQELVRFGYCTP